MFFGDGPNKLVPHPRRASTSATPEAAPAEYHLAPRSIEVKFMCQECSKQFGSCTAMLCSDNNHTHF